MSRAVRCPECAAPVRRAPEQGGAVIRCPQCGARFRVAGGSDDDADLPAPARKPRKKSAARGGDIRPFLRRWSIACGVVLGAASVCGVGGLFSEPLAIAATAICILALIGCGVAGAIWMAIDLAQENVPWAVITVLFPAAGPVFAFQSKGPARRGAVVFVSMLAPTLLLGLMTLVFYPKYSGAGRQAAHTARWEDLMRQLDKQLQPDSPVVSVTMNVASRPGALTGLEPKCEALLRQFQCYVPGTLKIDADARLLSYQYRGHERFDSLPAFYLGSATRAFTPQPRTVPPQPERRTDAAAP